MEDLEKRKTFDRSCAVLRSSQVQETGNVMVTPADQDDAGSNCPALVFGYHHDIDRGWATAGIDVFADDAAFEAHGRALRGRSEILDFLRAREADTPRQTVHVLADEVTTVQAGGPTVSPSSCRH
ncbi:hypothetical protein ACIBJC_29445 [Streptomyces sp. NPDC050509]|uniref:hypothetical protein n=1 Tax=Streptomyces sp. NPDC050509 TaxID=3365620 RepID=UPI0037AA6D1C